jgi:DNA-binding MarR family transcriptional regulator
MVDEMTPAGERFLAIMDRLRKMGLGNPSSGTMLISPAQMTLLDWIHTSPGCGVQNIAEGLELTPPTVSVGVRRLEEAGLLKRKPDPQDKRSVQLFLTVRGQAVQQQSVNFRRQKLELILSSLTLQEQETLLHLLAKALQTVETRNNVEEQEMEKTS